METQKTQMWKWVVAVCAAAAVSCAGPSAKNMIPDGPPAKPSETRATLNIADVEGGRKAQFGGMETLTNETFEEAILLTLRKSNLFRDVGAGVQANYDLFAEITSMDTVTDQSFTYTTYLVVNYRLFQSDDRREVWQKLIRSSERVTVGEAISGAARMTQSLEGATKSNLEKLVEVLSSLPDFP